VAQAPETQRSVAELQDSLRELTRLHRQLLDVCVLEREALKQADLKAIQEIAVRKQGMVDAIRAAEGKRMNRVASLAMIWKRPLRELTLPTIIADAQAHDPRGVDQLRSTFEALKLLISQITEANDANRSLVEKSLEHVAAMKKNVLGESVPKSNTYNPQGQRQSGSSGARLFNKEA